MSCYHITYKSGRKVATPVSTEAEYRAIRNSKANLKFLEEARGGNKDAKMRLAQFNYSGHYPEGKIKGCKLPSNAFVFDCDSPEDYKVMAEKLLAEPEKYGLLMLERSVNQGGHAVFKREKGKTILENQVRISKELQIEMDCSTHDINRVLFATSANPNDLVFVSSELFEDKYDEKEVAEEARLLEDRARFGNEELPEGAHSANKHYKPWLSTQTNEKGETVNQDGETVEEVEPSKLVYENIPYAKIIAKWWEKYNDGNEPIKSNRDVLTYELAYNLRHICGFSRELLDKVIPCYDGFEEEQKLKCIDSALIDRRTQMPRRLRDVLDELKQENSDDSELVNTIDIIQEEQERFYYNKLKNLPQGVKDSIEAVGPALTMPTLITVCPIIGMLATNVELDVHGRSNTLNLISFVAGAFASGKGNLDPVVQAWTEEIRVQDQMYLAAEQEYREKKKLAKNKKEQPEEPKLPIRYLTLNNTVANLAERLANTEGKAAFSFTNEADTMAQKMKSSMTDYSVMLRQAYDGSPYSREARSIDAVNVHIEHLRWNVVMVGTPDALYRVLNNNYTDGFQSRIAVATTPDNTFSPLEDKPHKLSTAQEERIKQIAHLLPLLNGKLVLPQLENVGRQWLERVRIESMKDFDEIKARQRFRVCVTTQRMVCCLILCKVCEKLIKAQGFRGAEMTLKNSPDYWVKSAISAQSAQILASFDVIADSLMETNLYFFRDKIRNSTDPTLGKKRKGKNKTIYASLSSTFTIDQAVQQAVAIKGADTTRNTIYQMLKNWQAQGLVEHVETGVYKKTENTDEIK